MARPVLSPVRCSGLLAGSAYELSNLPFCTLWPLSRSSDTYKSPGYGKNPKRIHCCRANTCASLFMCKQAIVARPTTVLPNSWPVPAST